MSRFWRPSEEEFAAVASGENRATTKNTTSEHAHQRAFFKWWREYAKCKNIPEQLCFAIPNASALSDTGRIYKWSEGLTAGVSDIFVAIPRATYHGLFLEMKRATGKISPDQDRFLHYVAEQGYRTEIAFSGRQAIEWVQNYLERPYSTVR